MRSTWEARLPHRDGAGAMRMMGRVGQYLLRHWRGELSLGVSYWVNGSALGLLLLVVVNVSAALLANGSLTTSALLGMILILLGAAHSLWSMVGIWRSAARHVERGGRQGWASLAQLMVMLGMLSTATVLIVQGGPALKEYALIITGNDPTGRVQLQLSRDGSVLLLSGGLGQGSAEAVRRQ